MYEVLAGSRPHDVAPAPDGNVWYTGQRRGVLGILDPDSGAVREVMLGEGSAPHGVILGPDDAAWITDSGQNAIVRVDPADDALRRFPLPAHRGRTNLNTASTQDGKIFYASLAGNHIARIDRASGNSM